jgi:hypothetical protein
MVEIKETTSTFSTPNRANCSEEDDDTQKKTVKFDFIEIWEFSLIPGDNPSVSGGPPVSMNYKPWRRRKCSLSKYEQHRVDDRRSREQLILPTKTREVMLRRIGYDRDQIQQCSMRAELIRNERLLTLNEMKQFAREQRHQCAVIARRE